MHSPYIRVIPGVPKAGPVELRIEASGIKAICWRVVPPFGRATAYRRRRIGKTGVVTVRTTMNAGDQFHVVDTTRNPTMCVFDVYAHA